MSDQTPAAPAAPVVPDPAVTPPAAAATPPPADPSLGPDGQPWDPERQQRALLAARDDARQARAQLAEAQAAKAELDTLKAAQLTDQERLQQERDAAVTTAAAAQEALRRGYLLAELSKPEHGIVDAESAAALITDVQFGDDGKPVNAGERITALLEAKGFLKATAVTPPAPRAPDINGGSGTAGAAPPNLTAEQIAFAQKQGIAPEKYAAWLNVSTAADAQALAPKPT